MRTAGETAKAYATGVGAEAAGLRNAVRVTTATPEQVGTLVTERAMAEARMPSQCELRLPGREAASPRCPWQRPPLGPEFRGDAPNRMGPPVVRQRNTRGSTVAP